MTPLQEIALAFAIIATLAGAVVIIGCARLCWLEIEQARLQRELEDLS